MFLWNIPSHNMLQYDKWLSFLLILFQGSSIVTCPNEWVTFDGHCYLFMDIPETWDNAKRYCSLMGGNLVIIETAFENSFLKRTLRHLYPHGGASYWTYGNDLAAEGKWVWGDADLKDADDDRSMIFTDWFPGEPSNGSTRCVQFFGSNFQWDDTGCTTKHNYICEKSDTGLSSSILG